MLYLIILKQFVCKQSNYFLKHFMRDSLKNKY